ncbi:unnamed protein product [Closterium sp. NIES-53]
MYLMTCTRPDLAYPLSLLACYVAPGRHQKVHSDAAERVLRYLCSTSGMGLVLALCQEHRLDHRTKRIALRYFLARELQQHGQLRLAYVASQANTADVFTKAFQPCDHQRVCTVFGLVFLLVPNSFASSIIPHCFTCRAAEQPSRPAAEPPSSRAAQQPSRRQPKHIALRYFLARELQQRGQLRLAYVASQANTADIFSKALPPGDHQRFCTMLGLVPTWPHLLTS